MRLFDPLRPLADGMPLFAPAGIGSAKYGLPAIYVEPGSAEGSWRLTIHMPTSANSFAGFEANIASTEDLAALFERWLADPEEVIRTSFAYDYNAKHIKSLGRARANERSVAQGLAELGLD